MAEPLFTWTRFLVNATLALLMPLLGGCAGLLFHPMEQHVIDPADHGIAYEEVHFDAADGTRLHGWILPASGPPRGTLVFAHGNAQNISTHINSVYWLPDAGYNVLLFDYRGYGRSQGEPDLAGVHRDAVAALGLARCFEHPSRIVALGQSIGGSIFAVAVNRLDWASQLGGLVVDSAPASYRDVARERLADWWLTWTFQVPLAWLIPDEYRAVDAARHLPAIPKLFIGNAGDRTVEVHHAERLYEHATAPKQIWRLDLPGHVPTFLDRRNRRRFIDWLARTLPDGRIPESRDACDRTKFQKCCRSVSDRLSYRVVPSPS